MKIKRTRPFLDTLELEDGDKQLTIVVNIHFERSAPLIRKAQVALIEAEKAIQKDREKPKQSGSIRERRHRAVCRSIWRTGGRKDSPIL